MSKKKGVAGVVKNWRARLGILAYMVKVDIKRRFGKKEAVGIMIGTNVQEGMISIRTQMSNGDYVAVCMNKAAVKELIHDMNMAIAAVTFKGRQK